VVVVNLFIFLLGCVIGSFLNVCIHRLPRGESILHPPSHCPKCQNKIQWYDNIPILSYLLLRGKCRHCKGDISPRYPIVEALTGFLFVLLNLNSSFVIRHSSFYFNAFFVSILIIAFFADLEEQIIPDEVIYLGIPVALLYAALRGRITEAVIGSTLGFLLLFLVQKLGAFLFKKEALGGGDIKLAALFGAQLLWQGLLLSLVLGYLIGAGEALLLLALRRKKWGEYIAFGPALVSGAFLTLFFGQQIIEFYFKLL
jgi:leader peptidase (prepilin peptidase)/N-methyltransferase